MTDLPNGQGNPLPDFMKSDGEWIIENVAFLYHAVHSTQSTATFTVGAAREDGSYARGFDSLQLAGQFGIDVESLLEANRSGLLVYVGDKDVPPTRGGVSAVSHIFRIRDHRASLIVETYQQEGHG
jgi:hypothetical protein